MLSFMYFSILHYFCSQQFDCTLKLLLYSILLNFLARTRCASWYFIAKQWIAASGHWPPKIYNKMSCLAVISDSKMQYYLLLTLFLFTPMGGHCCLVCARMTEWLIWVKIVSAYVSSTTFSPNLSRDEVRIQEFFLQCGIVIISLGRPLLGEKHLNQNNREIIQLLRVHPSATP